ncbi:GAF and ANTAR domain-containing protein [Mycobacterium sp. C31M]
MNRYNGLAFAFVGLADTLVADFDITALAQQLVESATVLHAVDAAGVALADPQGRLGKLASSGAQLRELDILRSDDGPCERAYRTGAAVVNEDLRADHQPWEQLARTAVGHGFLSLLVLPMTLRSDRVGALYLLRREAGRMADADMAIVRSLADVATIGILHQRVANQLQQSNQQLQIALDSRTVIEQAKGFLAAHGSIDVDRAFALLRGHARRTNTRLADLAQAVVSGSDTTAILNPK